MMALNQLLAGAGDARTARQLLALCEAPGVVVHVAADRFGADDVFAYVQAGDVRRARIALRSIGNAAALLEVVAGVEAFGRAAPAALSDMVLRYSTPVSVASAVVDHPATSEATRRRVQVRWGRAHSRQESRPDVLAAVFALAAAGSVPGNQPRAGVALARFAAGGRLDPVLGWRQCGPDLARLRPLLREVLASVHVGRSLQLPVEAYRFMAGAADPDLVTAAAWAAGDDAEVAAVSAARAVDLNVVDRIAGALRHPAGFAAVAASAGWERVEALALRTGRPLPAPMLAAPVAVACAAADPERDDAAAMVLRQANLSAAEVGHLYASGGQQARRLALRHPSCPLPLMESALGLARTREVAASNPALPEGLAVRLLSSGNERVLVDLAGATGHTCVLERLLGPDMAGTVRQAAALNPAAPPGAARVLPAMPAIATRQKLAGFYCDELGDDRDLWHTVLTLMESFSGTAGDLVSVARAL